MSLNDTAKEIDKQIVIAFDEFQQVGLLKENQLIEAAIRHAMERSKND